MESTVAGRLRRVRDFLGLSQREFARELHVTNGAVAHWESGHREMPGPVIRLLEIYEEQLGFHLPPSANPLNEILAKRLARNLSYLKISSSAASRWLISLSKSEHGESQRVRSTTHLAIANQIAAEMGKMKGLPMKLAQIMGYFDLGLPADVCATFAKLQETSAPLSVVRVKEILQRELGTSPQRLFSHFSPNPIAAASIGQVHFARLKSGEPVAVKVQYPNIEQALKSDLANLKSLQRFAPYLLQEKQAGDLLSELADRFYEECDYLLESRRQTFFRDNLATSTGVTIPRVRSELCTGRVLVSEFRFGKKFNEFAATGTGQEKGRAAQAIWQFIFQGVFRHGVVPVDPHPGNFIFPPNEVVMLDFGCTKTLAPNLQRGWRQVFRAMVEQRFDRAYEQLRHMGMINGDAPFDLDHFEGLMRLFYEPYLEDREYTFTPQYAKNIVRHWFKFNPNRKLLTIPKDWIFLTRILWGLPSLFVKLEARANWHRSILPLIYEDATTSIPPVILPHSMI